MPGTPTVFFDSSGFVRYGVPPPPPHFAHCPGPRPPDTIPGANQPSHSPTSLPTLYFCSSGLARYRSSSTPPPPCEVPSRQSPPSMPTCDPRLSLSPKLQPPPGFLPRSGAPRFGPLLPGKSAAIACLNAPRVPPGFPAHPPLEFIFQATCAHSVVNPLRARSTTTRMLRSRNRRSTNAKRIRPLAVHAPQFYGEQPDPKSREAPLPPLAEIFIFRATRHPLGRPTPFARRLESRRHLHGPLTQRRRPQRTHPRGHSDLVSTPTTCGDVTIHMQHMVSIEVCPLLPVSHCLGSEPMLRIDKLPALRNYFLDICMVTLISWLQDRDKYFANDSVHRFKLKSLIPAYLSHSSPPTPPLLIRPGTHTFLIQQSTALSENHCTIPHCRLRLASVCSESCHFKLLLSEKMGLPSTPPQSASPWMFLYGKCTGILVVDYVCQRRYPYLFVHWICCVVKLLGTPACRLSPPVVTTVSGVQVIVLPVLGLLLDHSRRLFAPSTLSLFGTDPIFTEILADEIALLWIIARPTAPVQSVYLLDPILFVQEYGASFSTALSYLGFSLRWNNVFLYDCVYLPGMFMF